ncbi:hypothetical protein AMK19_23390 [Kitasatospora sp. CB01950]|nr:hypothetical protein AMK19_23390 [Kitasatospora sp. CB01950]
MLLPEVVPAPAGTTPAPTAAGPRPLVIGLDVAIGTTGVAGVGWTEAIHANQPGLQARMVHQLTQIKEYVRRADFVVIEGAAFSRSHLQGADQLSAMRWMVRLELWKRGIPYAVCPPDNRTIFATGKARWKGLTPTQVKAKVREAVAEQYGIECEGRWRYDQADAYVLLAMGLAHLGHPLAELPATHTRALDGVAWPEGTDQ